LARHRKYAHNGKVERIDAEKDSLVFWEKAKMRDKAFKNERIEERKECIQKLESIKERNDSKE